MGKKPAGKKTSKASETPAPTFKKATHRRPVAESERRLVTELRAAIEASGIPWSVIGDKAEVARTIVTRFMTGDTDITLSNASRIAEVLDLHLRGTNAIRS